MSSPVEKKKKVFGKIAAAKTLTEGLPKLKLSSSFQSINNGGDSIAFLSDLIKSLIGYEALVSAVIDTITNSLVPIEKEVKKTLKTELKTIVNCGVDPHLPSWLQSTGNGIIIEVSKIDYLGILKVDPNSVSGRLLYNDITPILTQSSDFNTFLYGVIQDDGVQYNWGNIFNITFNSLGSGSIPNNTLTIKSTFNYNTKTLTDLNNNFIDTLTLFKTENILNQIIDIIYGTISSNIGKGVKQLLKEEQINSIIDKMVNNFNDNPITDSAFVFTNEESYAQQLNASNRRFGLNQLNLSTNNIPSYIPVGSLVEFTNSLLNSTTSTETKTVISSSINSMANITTLNVTDNSDKETVKLNFIQEIINNLIKGIINSILSPKVIFAFIINYKIVYGEDAVFSDPIDFIKKNKNLMNNVMKRISEEIIAILLSIALKEIESLVAQAVIKKQKEKQTLKLAQLQSLIGVPIDTIKKLTDNL